MEWVRRKGYYRGVKTPYYNYTLRIQGKKVQGVISHLVVQGVTHDDCSYAPDHWYIWSRGERLAGPFETSAAAKAAFLVICL